MPCDCCIKKYLGVKARIGGHQMNILAPFFRCVSHAVLGKGICGNCLWAEQKVGDCSYVAVAESLRAKKKSSLETGPRAWFLTPPTGTDRKLIKCPVLSTVHPPVTDEEWLAEAKEQRLQYRELCEKRNFPVGGD